MSDDQRHHVTGLGSVLTRKDSDAKIRVALSIDNEALSSTISMLLSDSMACLLRRLVKKLCIVLLLLTCLSGSSAREFWTVTTTVVGDDMVEEEISGGLWVMVRLEGGRKLVCVHKTNNNNL